MFSLVLLLHTPSFSRHQQSSVNLAESQPDLLKSIVKGGDIAVAKAKSRAKSTKSRPALTPEAQEQINIALAVKQAEEQLRNGTAPTQVIVHYLKLASSRELLEQESIRKKNEMMEAKTEAIKADKRQEELYAQAIEAMRVYNGGEEYLDYEDEDE